MVTARPINGETPPSAFSFWAGRSGLLSHPPRQADISPPELSIHHHIHHPPVLATTTLHHFDGTKYEVGYIPTSNPLGLDPCRLLPAMADIAPGSCVAICIR